MYSILSDRNLIHSGEDVLKCVRRDAVLLWFVEVPHHAVRLARARLAIGEYGAIVPLQHGFNDRVNALQVHVFLSECIGVDGVEGEGAAVDASTNDGNGGRTNVDLHAVFLASVGLFLAQWPHTDNDLYILALAALFCHYLLSGSLGSNKTTL